MKQIPMMISLEIYGSFPLQSNQRQYLQGQYPYPKQYGYLEYSSFGSGQKPSNNDRDPQGSFALVTP